MNSDGAGPDGITDIIQACREALTSATVGGV